MANIIEQPVGASGSQIRVPLRKHILRYIVLGLWSLLVLIPLWIMVVNSFKPQAEIYGAPFALPAAGNLDGYMALFAKSSFGIYFLNSFLITVLSIFGVMFFAGFAAYGIANWEHRVAKVILLLFVAGLMIPIRIGSINLLQIEKTLGLLDKLVGLLPIYIAMGMPMAVLVLSEYFRTVPKELTQAAWIDGAGSFRIYSTIIIPLARPALATVAIFTLVNVWNDLWFPLIFITNDTQRTLMQGVTHLFGQYATKWNQVLALLTMATIPILLLYVILSKQFIKGLTSGAIKE